MEKKEFLNEERYQKNKKKLQTIAIGILIIGILVGGSVIATVAIKANEIKKENEKISKQIEQEYAAKTRPTDQIQNDIDSLEQKIETVEGEVKALQNEQRKIFSEDRGFSDRYYEKETEIDNKKKELSKLEAQLSEYKHELNDIKSGYIESKKNGEISNKTKAVDQYDMLYGIGGLIIFISCSISGSVYMMSRHREIIAFQAQQVMPVAQEGMEKMATSFAKVGKTMAKEISKGIKEGMNDEDK